MMASFHSLLIFCICCFAANNFTAFSASSHSSLPHSSPSPVSSAANYSTLIALLDFKARIVDDPSRIFSSWNTSSHFCDWPGISCYANLTISLYLYGYNLSGTLSPHIANIKGLVWLELMRNQFYGGLPSSLGQMERLQYLGLSGNQLSGQMPTSLGRMKSLQTLYLSGNRLSGPLPSSLGQMKSLDYLDLSGNRLSGPLPSSLGQMKSLQTLSLSGNRLSGPLPSSLGQMQSLQALDLSGNRLSGPLPSSLGQMQSLQALDLAGNRLSGPLPSSLGQMQSLETLSLSGNRLSGPLPSSLGQMQSLYYLDLSSNQFSGPLPSSLGQLEGLYYLDLSYNQLSGTVSSLWSHFNQLPFGHRLLRFNLSYNRLEGLIPPSYQGIYSSDSFLGNPGLCGSLLSTSCRQKSLPSTNRDSGYNKVPIIVVACVAGPASLLLASLCAWWRYFKRKHPGSASTDFVAPEYQAWTAEEMRVATHNFDAMNVIGSGSVSMCYLGTMKLADGMRVVAVKRLAVEDYYREGEEARKSFVNEFKTLCRVRHRNLVKVMGYCVEGDEMALVMEYMEEGDLDRCLHNEGLRTLMSWEERVNVALDVAEGLVYLHHEYEQPIIHCDLKPKNILLKSDMVAKISDFGIARALDRPQELRGETSMSMSKLRGSFGFIAPEYGMGLRISTKADVYSYGMILLELVTGVRPTSPMLENEATSLRAWVEALLKSGKIGDVLKDYDLATLQEVSKLLCFAMQCTHDLPNERPTMYVVRDFILQLKNQ